MSSSLEELNALVVGWKEERTGGGERREEESTRIGLTDVRIVDGTSFRCVLSSGTTEEEEERTYRTRSVGETQEWLNRLTPFVVATTTTTRSRSSERTREKEEVESDGRRERPRSMRATHALTELKRDVEEWARRRAVDPTFTANIVDISITSPSSFAIHFDRTRRSGDGRRGGRTRGSRGGGTTTHVEKRVYETESAAATEDWIDRVAQFADMPLKILLTNGAKPPRWVADEDRDACTVCREPFSAWWRRRHHCRSCGEVVCFACASNFLTIPWLGIEDQEVRVCDYCARHWGEMLVFWHSKAANVERRAGSDRLRGAS